MELRDQNKKLVRCTRIFFLCFILLCDYNAGHLATGTVAMPGFLHSCRESQENESVSISFQKRKRVCTELEFLFMSSNVTAIVTETTSQCSCELLFTRPKEKKKKNTVGCTVSSYSLKKRMNAGCEGLQSQPLVKVVSDDLDYVTEQGERLGGLS